ncbi:hypothetical protein NKH24_16705 [Mesorhizobium sp. M1300]|uniref:hypothetical protein n=1 Tax=Mesorhizobium sp. M1300 TaxID=2957077 RepID=UPI003336FBA9
MMDLELKQGRTDIRENRGNPIPGADCLKPAEQRLSEVDAPPVFANGILCQTRKFLL